MHQRNYPLVKIAQPLHNRFRKLPAQIPIEPDDERIADPGNLAVSLDRFRVIRVDNVENTPVSDFPVRRNERPQRDRRFPIRGFPSIAYEYMRGDWGDIRRGPSYDS